MKCKNPKPETIAHCRHMVDSVRPDLSEEEREEASKHMASVAEALIDRSNQRVDFWSKLPKVKPGAQS